MRLLECYIENFGRLKDFRYTFTDGLNIFNEQNGFGKTTLSVFIKAMFYGLEDTKKAKLEENDRKHYLPWQGGRFGGSLSFESAKGRFRIERIFSAKASEDEYKLYDLETGKESTLYSERVGEEIFGIDADGFERTVFLSERRLSVKNDNKSISAKLSDLVGADGDVGEMDEALKLLEEKRKYYYKKGGSGRLGEIKSNIANADAKINALLRLRDVHKEKEERLKALKIKIGELEKAKDTAAKKEAFAAYENQYKAMDSAKLACERSISEIKQRFGGTVPTDDEVRTAERASDEYSRLGEALQMPKRQEVFENTAELDTYIKLASESKNQNNVNKTFHFWFIGAASSAVIGALLGAFVLQILYTVSVFAVPCLIFGFLNLKALSSKEKEETALLPTLDFINRRTETSVTRERLLEALVRIKAENEAKEKLYENSLREFKIKESEQARQKEILDSFYAKYAQDSPSLSEIREQVMRYNMLVRELAEKEKALVDFASKYGIDRESTQKNGDNLPSIEELDLQCRAARSEYTLLLRECNEDAEEISSLDELYEKRAELSDELCAAEEYYNTVLLTKEHLTKAKDRLTARYLGGTRSAFDRYLAEIGNESGEGFTMNTSFELTKSEGAKSVTTDAYSLGTRDFYALAARLALVDALYENESPFIILDDPFVHLDDKKTAAALNLIEKLADKRQIIYFTCSSSRCL